MKGLLTVAFTGGGTGGHIYPGLAVAEEVRTLFEKSGEKVRIVWIGSRAKRDREMVEKAIARDGRKVVDAFYPVSSGKLRRYFSLKNFTDVFRVMKGFFDSLYCLMKIKPILLFSKGGFVSTMPCAASYILHIKVFTHECDFTAGLATRLNARFAQKILLTYPETASYINAKYRSLTVTTGNPVRSMFYDAANRESEAVKEGLSFLNIEKKDKIMVLFIGGSLGAAEINTLVKDNLDWLLNRFIVVHQTGINADGGLESEGYGRVREGYFPFSFIHSKMPCVMASCDIIVSRAGASAIWESCVLKKPMVLIPLCGEGTRGDQKDNAKYFEKKGAAIMLAGEDARGERLRGVLEGLMDCNKRERMRKKCLDVTGGVKAAEKIAQMIYDACGAESIGAGS